MNEDLAQKVVDARKAAQAAMPLGHGVTTGSEARGALIFAAMVQAVVGGDAPDFSQAPEYVEPQAGEDAGEGEEAEA